MDIFNLAKLYIENGLKDFTLRGTDDLLNIHNIDFEKVKGYDKLDDINRAIFKKFIVKFYNARDIVSRTTTSPLGIYYVEDKDYIILHPDNESLKDDYDDRDVYISIGTKITAMYRDGSSELIKEFKEENYDYTKDYEEIEIRNYLRFEVHYYNSNEWLHVAKNGEEWY